MDIESKQCGRCGMKKQLTDFYTQGDNKYQSYCKQCCKEYRIEKKEHKDKYNKEYYSNNREYCLQKSKKYRQENRESCSEYDRQYYINNIEIKRKYRQDNRERSREWERDFRKMTPARKENKRRSRRLRRAREKNQMGTVHPKIEELLFQSQLGFCFICFGDLYELNWELDHIIPIAKGGLHDDSNLQLLCASCNRSKSDKI